ncbi:MAG: ComF family protein [Cyanobacteria bacterium P01_H01_bin.21]
MYQNVLKQTLILLKYGNQAELGFWLGYLLGQWWQSSKAGYCQRFVVVPIPLHKQRLQQRGYNQAALIAKGFCRTTRMTLAEHSLVRVRATDAMHCLGANERTINLAGAFQLGNRLPPIRCPILLIDDIYTTGTTGNVAALLLKQAGYTVIGIATVAQAVLSSRSAELAEPSHLRQKPNLRPNP